MRPPSLLLDTLRLGGEPITGSLADAWRTADTTGLLALVEYEGCGLWLYRRLREGHVRDVGRRLGFYDALARGAKRLAARGMAIDEETAEVARIADREGIPCVLLKGTARRAAASLYPYADARDTLDIDLLAPEGAARTLWDRLRAEGYRVLAELPAGHFHLDPLFRPGGVGVEIHTTTSRAVRPEEAWQRAVDGGDTIACAGHSVSVPSATELLWHALVHSLHQGPAGFRLRYLLDCASVCASGRAVDWEVIGRRLGSAEIDHLERARMWLAAGTWLGAETLPAAITPPRAPYRLRRALRWRLAVLRRSRVNERWREKLLEEGDRAEAGLPLQAGVPETGVLVKNRRRVAAAIARSLYLAWRAVDA